MNWRRAAMWTAGAVAVAAAAGAWAVHALVDPERLRKAARDHALAAWERELLLGDVTLDLLPRPALRASDVSFANPRWASEPHLLHADVVRADLEFLPLLTGKLRVRQLSLEGVRAGLEVADDGEVSWGLRRRAPPAEQPAPAEGSTGEPLHVSAVHIRNARVTFRERRETGEPWLVEEASIEALPGLADVRLDAKVKRHGQAARITARFGDLSALGDRGATTQGHIDVDWGGARLEAKGRFPLERALDGQDLAVSFRAESLQPVLAFFGMNGRRTARAEVRFRARDGEKGAIRLQEVAAVVGPTRLTGEALVRREPRLAVEADLRADRIDWLETLKAAGGEIRPPRQNQEIFHEDPVAWRGVAAVGAVQGRITLAVKSLELGNGVDLGNFKAQVALGDGRIDVASFSAAMLGGTGKGSLRLDGRKRTAHFALDGEKLLLERWFRERGRKIPFEGGPMQVEAKLDLAGDTYRELAASTSGTLTIRMGKGTINSPRAGEMEEMMVRALAPKDGRDVSLDCVVAKLRFESGRARGKGIVGARSDVSQILASGEVDLREETLDLRGRLVPRSGPRIGLASFAGEVQVTGKLAKPTMRLDPDAKPLTVARVGAAIASAGATVIGGALLDAAASQENPCK